MTAPMPDVPDELIDQAAERGHDAMFEGSLSDGIERALWHQVVRAILATPGLLADTGWEARLGMVTAAVVDDLRTDRDLLLWLHAEAAWRVAGFEALTVSLARTNKDLTAEQGEILSRISRVLASHSEIRVYTECGHHHDEEEVNTGQAKNVDDVGFTCEDGFMYSICRSCCCDDGEHQSGTCVDDHEYPCWPCQTHATLLPSALHAVRAALQGDQPDLAALKSWIAQYGGEAEEAMEERG